MSGIAIAFLSVVAAMLLVVPRRWAPLALMIGACYMTLGQGIELGPFNFPFIRILLAVGFARVIIRGERLAGSMNMLDWLMLVWAGWAVGSSCLKNDPSAALIFRLGLVYNTCGVYFLLRIFCGSLNDVLVLICCLSFLLMPLAAEMLYEKVTLHNLFSVFGGVPESPSLREGRIRAQGPFAHAILAGTVGGVCLPFMVGIWPVKRKTALMGIFACLAIVFSSASSGPIMSTMAATGALLMWHYRASMRFFRWFAIIGYIGLDLVMKAPAYYLIARIDLTGGSTGWHRAALIEAAFKHLREWWLAGTDYTRHWMPTGVSWSENHTDITNYYLHFGVVGGLPLMLLFIIIVVKGFSFVGQTLRGASELSPESQFFVWSLGASLFAHSTTCVSVSYFDQSFVFLYMTLAAISSVWSATRMPLLTVTPAPLKNCQDPIPPKAKGNTCAPQIRAYDFPQ